MNFIYKDEPEPVIRHTGLQITSESILDPHLLAIKLMATWISAIADQVRNPIAGLSAAASLIEKQMNAFRSQKEWNPAIVEEAARLMQIRLAKFDHYMMELGGFTREVEVNPRWVNLQDEWLEIQKFVSKRVTGDVKIFSEFDEQWSRAYVDSDKLQLVMAAVIMNAIEACGSDRNAEVCVHVRRASVDQWGRWGTLIEICDNGPGFTKAAMISGLNPFFTTKEAGTGLGLAMVEKYVRAHGGRLTVGENTKCKNLTLGGARVELYLPDPIE